MEALARSLAQSRWTSNALRLLFPAPNSKTQHLFSLAHQAPSWALSGNTSSAHQLAVSPSHGLPCTPRPLLLQDACKAPPITTFIQIPLTQPDSS